MCISVTARPRVPRRIWDSEFSPHPTFTHVPASHVWKSSRGPAGSAAGLGVFSDVGLSCPSCWNAATRIWAQGETVGRHLGGLQVTGRFALRGAHRRSLMTTWASIWLVSARTSRPIYATRCLCKAKRLGFS